MRNNIQRQIENIYIHLPFCQKKCFYCSFPIHAIGKNSKDNEHFFSIQKTYLTHLIDEINVTNKALFSTSKWQKQPLKSIYFGGGTPSLFKTDYIKEILDAIKQIGFEIKENTEITMECDPGTFNGDTIKHYEEMQINRISLGLQSFNDAILSNLNRPQNASTNFDALDILKKSQTFNTLNNVSIDLIMNLPQIQCQQIDSKQKQNTQALTRDQIDQIWEDDIKQAIQINPGHLSIYSLSIEPGSYFYEKNNYREGQFPLPSNQRSADMFVKTHNLLKPHYNHYEISSFIQNGKAIPIHNPIYWEGNKEFIAFGMGASSLIGNKRFTRPKNISKYYDYVNILKENPNYVLENGEDEADVQSQIESILMGRLRTQQGLDLDQIKNIYGDEIFSILMNKITQLCSNSSNIKIDNGFLRLNSPNGYLVCDDIVAEISYYLQNKLTKLKLKAH